MKKESYKGRIPWNKGKKGVQKAWNKTPIEKEKKIIKLYKENKLLIKEICKLCDIKRSVIYSIIKKNKITKRGGYERTKEHRNASRAVLNTPEVRKKISESLKGHIPWNKGKKGVQKSWNRTNPEIERKVIELYKKKLNMREIGDEVDIKFSTVSRILKRNKIKIKPNVFGVYKRTKKHKKVAKETLLKMVEGLKKKDFKAWQEMLRKSKNVGKNNPGYIHGEAQFPYGPEFNKPFRKGIRELYDNKCVICGKPAKCVHHINYKKDDTFEENSILLCGSCHPKTNFNVDYWFALFCYMKEIEPEDLVEWVWDSKTEKMVIEK